MEHTIQLLYNGKVLQYYRGLASKNIIINNWKKKYPKEKFYKCKIDVCEQGEYGIVPVMKASTKLLML